MLFGALYGASIVDEKWIHDSLDAALLLSDEKYRSPLVAATVEHSDAVSLFECCGFYIGGETKMSRDVLQKLIRQAGGRVHRTLKQDSICIAAATWAEVPCDLRVANVPVVKEESMFDAVMARSLEPLRAGTQVWQHVSVGR